MILNLGRKEKIKMGNILKFILEYQDYIENIENSDKDNYIYNEILKRSYNNKLKISEGLIKTYPTNKSVDILKRRFPELDIEIDADGEIYIYNLNDKLSKYIPIITNLGYFISQITKDGNNWQHISINDYLYAKGICIEAKYDYEVVIPNILYHASPIKLKNKILKNGLSPRTGNKIAKHPERIYLTDNINTAIQFGKYLKGEENNEWYQNGFCIYSVDGKGISNLYSDVNLRQGGFYTMNYIKPEYIKIICENKS